MTLFEYCVIILAALAVVGIIYVFVIMPEPPAGVQECNAILQVRLCENINARLDTIERKIDNITEALSR